MCLLLVVSWLSSNSTVWRWRYRSIPKDQAKAAGLHASTMHITTPYLYAYITYYQATALLHDFVTRKDTGCVVCVVFYGTGYRKAI